MPRRRHLPGIASGALVLIFAMAPGLPARAQQDPMSEGRRLLQSGDPLRAHPMLQEAVARNPQSADGWYVLGYCQMQLSRLESAQASLGRAVALNPREPAWWHALAKARLDAGKPSLAVRALDQAIALDAKADYFHARALCRLALQDLPRAEQDLRACVERAPAHAAALQALGRMELDRGAAQAAHSLFERSVAADPAQVDARFRLGMSASALGRQDEAAAAFREVLERVPQHVGALWNLARILRSSGNDAEARSVLVKFRDASVLEDEIRFLEEFVRLAPGDVGKRVAFADALLRAGRTDEALAQADAARAADPSRADAWRLLASALERLGRADDASAATAHAARLGGGGR